MGTVIPIRLPHELEPEGLNRLQVKAAARHCDAAWLEFIASALVASGTATAEDISRASHDAKTARADADAAWDTWTQALQENEAKRA